MKKIKKVVLKEARTLSDEEMMHLFGGSAAPTEPEDSGKTCYCMLINESGYKTPAAVIMKYPSYEGCVSGCADICMKSPDLCYNGSIEVSYY